MSTVNVRSVQALEDQRAAFNRLKARCWDALNAVEMDIRRTKAWLEERERFWRSQLEEAEDERAYRAVMEEYQKVLAAMKALAEAAAAYHEQARRFAALLNNDIPRATTFLSDKIAALHAYIATHSTLDVGSTSFAGLGLSTSAMWHNSTDAQSAAPIAVTDEDSLEARAAQVRAMTAANESNHWSAIADTAEERAEHMKPTMERAVENEPPDTHMHGGQAETTRGVERERGPESYEGALGGPERRG